MASSSKPELQVDMARDLSPHQLLREFRKAVPVALNDVADKLNDEEHLYGGLGELLPIVYSFLATGLQQQYLVLR